MKSNRKTKKKVVKNLSTVKGSAAILGSSRTTNYPKAILSAAARKL
jgi:hypothetical protein